MRYSFVKRMASKWVGELGMPKKGGDSYVSTVRGLDIGVSSTPNVFLTYDPQTINYPKITKNVFGAITSYTI